MARHGSARPSPKGWLASLETPGVTVLPEGGTDVP